MSGLGRRRRRTVAEKSEFWVFPASWVEVSVWCGMYLHTFACRRCDTPLDVGGFRPLLGYGNMWNIPAQFVSFFLDVCLVNLLLTITNQTLFMLLKMESSAAASC